jgi:ankyrin repeat protein
MCGRRGCLEAARELVRAGTDLAEKADNDGHVPLTCAVTGGHLEVANRFLLEIGVDARKKNNKGLAALGQATRKGHCLVIRDLVEQGPTKMRQTGVRARRLTVRSWWATGKRGGLVLQ